MELYHFTAIEHIESIMTYGLNRGEVVIDSPNLVGNMKKPDKRRYYGRNLIANGVNLTTDSDPAEHGLGEPGLLTASQRRFFEEADGVRPPNGARFADKRQVRIQIDLPEHSHGLFNWLQWSTTKVDKDTRRALILSGGGFIKASTWYVSFETIPTSAIVEIGIRNEAGCYVACRSRSEVQQAIMALNRLVQTSSGGNAI